MAGGAMVLSGGAAIVGVVIGIGIGTVFKHMDQAEHRRVLDGRLILVERQVEIGCQREWE